MYRHIRSRARTWLTVLLPAITGLCLLFELISLRIGLLDAFFYDSTHAHVQGIDYFSLPRAFLNLESGRSAYDTFSLASYGPAATWYLSHPALAVWCGSLLSLLSPWTGYGAFVLLSILLMAAAAFIAARESTDPLLRRALWMLFLCGFPTYWMLYVGNPQAFLVLALTLIVCGVLRIARGRQGAWEIGIGLLLSFFSKPVVLLMLPLLLLLRETRRAAAIATAIYAGISGLFELLPALNPQALPLARLAWLAVHPGWVRTHMNIYANGFQLTPEMLDNSVHWFNLVAQSSYRLNHVDVLSLPLFLDTLFGVSTPEFVYWLPNLLVIAMSVLAARRSTGREERMQLALLVVCACATAYFLSYPTIWEYQYTATYPVAAALCLLPRSFYPALWMKKLALGLSACFWLPSFFVFLPRNAAITPAQMEWIRADRVIPALLLFALMIVLFARKLREGKRRVELTGPQPRQDHSSPAANPGSTPLPS
ncbi:hypothetical protein [Silvibacterium sp.]|uniref:hypothetical protein n=1 Tax=Silvibacterium sp. TaxID=1964179 RepID=UPI0039E72069